MKLIALALLVLASTITNADPSGAPPEGELTVGTNFTKFNYIEMCSPNDTEAATFNSLLVTAKIYYPQSWSYLDLRYENASTKSNYSGATISTGATVIGTDKLTFTDYVGTANLALSDMVYVYTGYAQHTWLRVLQGGSTYSETYSWAYIPIGVTGWYIKDAMVEAGVNFELEPTMQGRIKVNTSSYIAGGQDSTATLGDKTNFKITLPIVWTAGSFTFRTTPWFQHLEIGQSNTITNTTLFSTAPHQGYEPSSDTYVWGLEVSLGVRF